MTTAVELVGLGAATLDILIRAETLPTWERSSRYRAISFDGGGPAGTAVAAAARLGVRAGFVGTAGSDEMAEMKLRLLSRHGVDVSRVVRRTGPDNAVVVVLVREGSGDRLFFGGGRQGEAQVTVAELDREYIASARFLHLDGLHTDAALAAAQWMREAGGTVVLDAGSAGGSMSKRIMDLVPFTDVLISGSGFARAATGVADIMEAGAKVLAMGPRVFVETEGEKGSFTVTESERFHTPAFPVEVVDTTGAGDAFHGAYIAGLCRGWDLRRTAVFASAVSAINCTRFGGRSGLPDFEETTAFLRARGAEGC